MSYPPNWAGKFIQLLSIDGNNLSINPGNTVVLPSGGNVSTIETASISSLTVSTVNGGIINANVLNVNTLIATSSFEHYESTTFLQVPVIQSLSSINGLPISSFINDALPISTVSSFDTLTTNFFNVSSISSIGSKVDFGASEIRTSGFIGAGGINCFQPSTTVGLNPGVFEADVGGQVQDISGESAFNMTANSLAVNGPSFSLQHIAGASGASQVGAITMYFAGPGETNGTVEIQDDLGTNTIFQNGNLATSSITVSTINGTEFTTGGIVVSTIATTAISSITAAIQQGLMSSIVFNPQISPQFNIDLGLGDFGIGLGTGLFAVAVAVPTTVGTLTYGITKGLASLFEPKPVNNITNTQLEVFNYQTQLQISTFGNYISSYNTFLSTIPSTVVINNQPTFSTVSSIAIPVVISTISQSANPTCVRSLGDPFQTVSTPWTYSQAVNDYQWVEIPAGGLGSNVSTLTLSTLTLAPSTILRGVDGLGGVLEVLETPGTGSYGQVVAQGYTMSDSVGASNGTFIYNDSLDRPIFLDNLFSSHTLAYVTDIAGYNPNPVFSTVLADIRVETGSVSTGNLFAQIIESGLSSITNVLEVNEIANVSTLNVNAGLNYTSPNSVITAGINVDGTAEITFQNQSSGSNASAFFFAVENTGGEYAGFGQNSLNLAPLYNTLFELPGSAVMSGTLDLVLGPQSDHSSNSGIYLTYQDGSFAHHINSNGALSFNASYNGTVNEGDFGVAGRVLQTNGSVSTPTWVDSIALLSVAGTFLTACNANLSTISTNAMIGNVIGGKSNYVSTGTLTLTTTPGFNFTAINTDRGEFVSGVLQPANPAPGFITKIEGIDSTTPQGPAFISLYPARSTIGVNKVITSGSHTLDVSGNVGATAVDAEYLTAVSTVTTNFFNIVNPYNFGDPEVNYNAYFTLSNGVIRMVTPTPTSNVAMRELLFGDGTLYYQLGNGDFSSGAGEAFGWRWTSMNNNDFYMGYDISGTVLNVNNRVATQDVFASGVVSTNTLIANVASVSSATISSIAAPVAVPPVINDAGKVAAQINYDYFTGYNTFQGQQPIQGGYFVQLDNSLSGGVGQATFIFPQPISSIQTVVGTYFRNTTTQATHPIWVGNAVNDANNNISTVQVYGDQNQDVFVHFIGNV